MAQTVKQKQAAAKAKLAKKAHAQGSKERANEVVDLKMAYSTKEARIAVADVLEKIAKFQSYHIKIAQDGVGAKKTGYKLENGQEEVENVYLTSEQRAGHLDKSAGQQEIADYIERMQTPISEELHNAAK